LTNASKFVLEKAGNVVFEKEVECLCWSITDPSKRSCVNKLTTRSLLGNSPINENTRNYWREAIFRTSLANGPQYLMGIDVKKYDYVLGW
jgi:hypothetical protein